MVDKEFYTWKEKEPQFENYAKHERVKNMDEGKFTECLTSIFDSIVSSERSESKKLIRDALEKLKQSNLKLTDPEEFNGFLVYKLNRGIKEIAKTMHDNPQKEIKDTYKPDFIYTHYDFLEYNLRELCVLREGSSCCADKSRSILNMYLNYSLTGKIPEFNPDIEHYWIPKFGNYKQWIDLCDGLYGLYYGKTEQYFKSYHDLIQAEIRKYKHILHTWYMEFNDGETIEFDHSWDDKDQNPLESYADKGDFYTMYKKKVKGRNFNIYEPEDEKEKFLYRDSYIKIPKSEIKQIYKKSEERMV